MVVINIINIIHIINFSKIILFLDINSFRNISCIYNNNNNNNMCVYIWYLGFVVMFQ